MLLLPLARGVGVVVLVGVGAAGAQEIDENLVVVSVGHVVELDDGADVWSHRRRNLSCQSELGKKSQNWEKINTKKHLSPVRSRKEEVIRRNSSGKASCVQHFHVKLRATSPSQTACG